MNKKIRITTKQKDMLENKASAKLTESIPPSQSPSFKLSKDFKKQTSGLGIKTENTEEMSSIEVSVLAPKVLNFLKQIYTNPNKESLDPYWESVDVSWDDLIQLLTELELIRSVKGGYRLQKLNRVEPKHVVKIVTRLIEKFINEKNEPAEPVEEEMDLSKPMSNDKLFKGKVEEWLEKFTNPRVEFLFSEGDYKSAWLTLRKVSNPTRVPKLEEDNLPMGAGMDSNAPFNQEEPPEGKQPSQHTLDLVLFTDEFAFFNKDGKLYVYNVESADYDEYGEYASRETRHFGNDEHGDPSIEHGDFEVDGNVVSGYVNDNIKHLSTGRGLNDWHNGVELVEVDTELAQDLLSIAKYIKDPKTAEQFIGLLKNIGLEETTTAAGSSGQFTGALSNGPISKGNTASEMNSIIGEDGDMESTKSEVLNKLQMLTRDSKITPAEWFSLESELRKVVDMIVSLNDEEWNPVISFIVNSLQIAESVLTGDNTNFDKFKVYIRSLIQFTNHFASNMAETTTSTSVGGDSGTFAFDAPVGDGGSFWTAGNKMAKKGPVKEMVGRGGKDAKTDTQWPDGQFVEFDDCTKLNNNKVAQNGGCSTGAVDNVVKTKSSKNSIISDSSIYEDIAKATGRTIKDVKSIIDGKITKSK